MVIKTSIGISTGLRILPSAHDRRQQFDDETGSPAVNVSALPLADGHARLHDAHTVEINGELHSVDHILIATGGWPHGTDARGTGLRLKIHESRFRPLKLTLTDSPERTFMKLVVDADSDHVPAVHMVGPEAGEILQGLAVALKAGAPSLPPQPAQGGAGVRAFHEILSLCTVFGL